MSSAGLMQVATIMRLLPVPPHFLPMMLSQFLIPSVQPPRTPKTTLRCHKGLVSRHCLVRQRTLISSWSLQLMLIETCRYLRHHSKPRLPPPISFPWLPVRSPPQRLHSSPQQPQPSKPSLPPLRTSPCLYVPTEGPPTPVLGRGRRTSPSSISGLPTAGTGRQLLPGWPRGARSRG